MSSTARMHARRREEHVGEIEMTKKLIVAIAVSAIACTAWASSASAKHKHKVPQAPALQQAATIGGANPMTNAPPSPAAEHPLQAQAMPGVNPMTNAPASPAVQNPAPVKHINGA